MKSILEIVIAQQKLKYFTFFYLLRKNKNKQDEP